MILVCILISLLRRCKMALTTHVPRSSTLDTNAVVIANRSRILDTASDPHFLTYSDLSGPLHIPHTHGLSTRCPPMPEADVLGRSPPITRRAPRIRVRDLQAKPSDSRIPSRPTAIQQWHKWRTHTADRPKGRPFIRTGRRDRPRDHLTTKAMGQADQDGRAEG